MKVTLILLLVATSVSAGWRHGPTPGHFHGPRFEHGPGRWHHWEHPFFAFPMFRFEWHRLRALTCMSEDSQGHTHSATRSEYCYDYEHRIREIEDESLDRCYEETRGDSGCHFITCAGDY